MASTRELGLYARFSLSRALAGYAPVVVFTALVRPTPGQLDEATVHRAISVLLAKYPLLRCSIADSTTSRPRYVHRPSTTPEEVMPLDPTEAFRSSEEALNAGTAVGVGMDVSQGPLWRVWLDPASDGQEAANADGRRRITLAAHHTIADGTGARNLFAEILALLYKPEEVPAPVDAFPPTMESTVDTKSPLSMRLQAMYASSVAPYLPSFLHTPLPPTFPNPPATPPQFEPHAVKLFSLSPTVLAGLKNTGKAHGVKTLQPLLYCATLAAFSTAISDTSDSIPPFTFSGLSPMSERVPSLGHLNSTGNYVSCHAEKVTLAALLPQQFWPACAAYAARLVNPDNRRIARQKRGMFVMLPDGEYPAEGDKPARTGWEKEIERILGTENPWLDTFEVSNLGVLPATGWEEEGRLEGVYWSQTASPFRSAFAIGPVCVRGGDLTFSCAYRANAIPEETASKFWQAFETLLRRLAKDNVPAEATFADLNRLAVEAA
ncbi:hypothetical protein JCM10207_006894 [Rhodosporidiobolus poonsookiae]